MAPLVILGVLIYGAFIVSALIAFIIITATLYEDNVGEVLDDSQGICHVFLVIPRMLGKFRFFLLCVMAVLWPLSMAFLFLLSFPSRGVTFEELPLTTQRVLLWLFLGFGKFTPDPNYVPVREEY